ncbi:ribonuclease P subunit p30 family protein [Aspergillus melleus]|uniref:ribonuclease P subunit p30 family protein n=1 Tax=Aspergillus melleus TaxID=138277 RepID=UPI001E8D0912|nr:RNA-binding RNA processing protein rpp1 [Aspergillus melleus]KAH8433708.1 RNA-binding RNA processing protein rpp1 [Aspergillus melleus]
MIFYLPFSELQIVRKDKQIDSARKDSKSAFPAAFNIAKMFYDLNVPYSPDDPEISPTLSFLAELGYTTVALSQTVTGKLPSNPTPPPVPKNVPEGLTLLNRLNLTLSDPAQNQRLASLSQVYDLVALRPTNEKALLNACTNLECDVISVDFSVRQPYHFKFKMLSAAIARGIRIEICYGPGVTGSGTDARRNLIGNSMSLIRATRGRGIIISSEARRALGVRAPWDVINLACVWGLSQERGKEAICEEARKVTALAKLKRTSWRGIVDVVDGGQKPKPKSDTPVIGQKKAASKPKNNTEGHGNADSLKRKASVGSETVEAEKPLSKREIKRRATKARLNVVSGDSSDTGAAAKG